MRTSRVIFALLGLMVLATGLRVFIGVGLNDESFYLATLYRFCLGGRPFIDEGSHAQINFLSLYPFMKLFLWGTGGNAGLVLFTRILYFLFGCLCASIVYRTRADELPAEERAILASMFVLYFPWNIQNFSYNSTPALSLATGIFLWYYAEKHLSYRVLFAAGAFHALALSASQVLLVPFIYFLAAATVTWRGDRKKFLGWYLGGGLAIAVCFVPALLNLAHDGFAYVRGLGEAAGDKPSVITAFRALIVERPLIKYFIGFSLLTLALFHRFGNRPFWLVSFVAAAGLPFLEFTSLGAGLSVHFFLSYFALLSPLLILLIRGEVAGPRRLFAVGWITSLGAGVMTTWASTNWTGAASVGLFAGALTTMHLVFLLLRQERLASPRYAPLYSTVGLLALAIPLLSFAQLKHIYSDGSLGQLTARVSSGPFWGLRTTPERASFLAELESELAKIPASVEGILFYEHLPAGYLMSKMMPVPGTLWILQKKSDLEEALLRRPGQKAVVRVLRPAQAAWLQTNGPFGNELDQYIEKSFPLSSETPSLKVFLTN